MRPNLTKRAHDAGISVDQAAIDLLKGLVFPMHHILFERALPLTLEDFFETLYTDVPACLLEIDLDLYQEAVVMALVNHRDVRFEEAYKVYGRLWALQQMAKAAVKTGGAQ